MTPSAQCDIPDGPNYRRADWLAGLEAVGFTLRPRIADPRPGDVLVIWNRSNGRADEANRFERAGARVLVAENGYMGKMWRGQKWFALSEGHHAGAGWWPNLGPQRWDSWGVELRPWAGGGNQRLVFAQRGIGEPGVASPTNWAEGVARAVGGRIRAHPGANVPAVLLADDLVGVEACFTWNSSAALMALTLGWPVFYGQPSWIGAHAALPISTWPAAPLRDDAKRLIMFQRLAWAMWTADEVRTGAPFDALRRS